MESIFDFLEKQQQGLVDTKPIKKVKVPLKEFPFGLGQCIYVYNYKEQKVVFQNGVRELLGYDENEFTSELIHTYFHPDDNDILIRLLQAIISFARVADFRQDQGFFYLTYRIRRKCGDYIKVMRQSYVYEISNEGCLISNMSVLTDVSAFDKTDNVSWDFKANGLDIEEFKKFIGAQYQNYFSKREMDIAKFVAQGLSSKEIALKLFISSHTVDTHRRKILKKTNCKNSMELTVFCLKNGIF